MAITERMKYLPLFLLTACGTFLQAGSIRQDRPNFLFIISDDQSWEMLGLLGSQVQTPNLDRLARKGTLFTHAYNMGGWHGAVCVASRTSLNTGRTLWNLPN